MPIPPKTDRMLPLDESSVRDILFEEKTAAAIWQNLTPEDFKDYRFLCRAMKKLVFRGMAAPIINVVASYMYHRHYNRTGHYMPESDWMAQQSNGLVTRAQTAMIQRMYTWAHVVGVGCTTCCAWDEHSESMVCFRSLDWDGARELGLATRIYDFRDKSGTVHFSAAGILGMVGMLTGVKPGFSIAINYLPWRTASAQCATDPLLMLRMILENATINTYDEALTAVEDATIGAPACFTICGIEKNQACAVEVGKNSKKFIRTAKNGFLAQTNHYDTTSPFSAQSATSYDYPVGKRGNRLADWHDGSLLPGSPRRRLDISMALRQLVEQGADMETGMEAAYRKSPVWNFETAQWAFMRPKDGTIKVWKRTPFPA